MNNISVAILCGGVATRMKPISDKIPKSLILVNNKPFIEYQLDFLRKQNLKNIVLLVGHKGEMIEKHLATLPLDDLNINFCYDGGKLLGTGGAVKQALSVLTDTFIVMYGDSYLHFDIKPILNHYAMHPKKEALMTVFKNRNLYDSSNVFFANGQILKYSKKEIESDMEHIDWGLSVLSKDLFSQYPSDCSFDLSEILTFAVDNDKLSGLEVFNRFYEIGSHRGLKELEKFLSSN